jgi:hypothetical protein
MISKGIIIAIDFQTTLCHVRIPIFEREQNQEVIMSAAIVVPPGMSVSYQVGDVVFVSFCDNSYSLPIILGKLYTGVETLGQNKLALCSELEVQEQAKLPLGTTYLIDTTSSLSDQYAAYNSVKKIIDELMDLKKQIELKLS